MKNYVSASKEILKVLKESGVVVDGKLDTKHLDFFINKIMSVAGRYVRHNAEDISNIIKPQPDDIKEVVNRMADNKWADLPPEQLVNNIVNHYIEELVYARVIASVTDTLNALGFTKIDKGGLQ